MSPEHFDVIVIGGGAAGLMCAATAAARGRKVLLLEKSKKLGRKILMSGGGRCNFTNLDVSAENFISQNPHFPKSALSRYTQFDFIALVDRHHLAYHEKEKGQLFCDDSAKDILNILLDECDRNGVFIRTNISVQDVSRASHIETDIEGFDVATDQGNLQCESLVVATGGLSIPSMGATGYGYQLAEKFGLHLVERKASLVPFVLNKSMLKDSVELAGLSQEVEISTHGFAFEGPLLFTHRGVSGPSVLQISNYWDPAREISVNLIPKVFLLDKFLAAKSEQPDIQMKTLLSRILSKRLARTITDTNLLFSSALKNVFSPMMSKPLKQITASEVEKLESALHNWCFLPAGTEGYKTAEVTKGGVDTNELSSKTFESKKCKGLYFIGEVVDVTGWLGGYNFQWAWSSGYCAGCHV